MPPQPSKSRFGGIPLQPEEVSAPVTPYRSQFGGEPLQIPEGYSTDPSFVPTPMQRYVGRLAENLAGAIPGTVEAVKHPIDTLVNIYRTPITLAEQFVYGKTPEALADITSLAAPAILKGVGKLAGRTAESLAERSIGIRKIDRAYSKTPGKAMLEETGGLSPEAVADSARRRTGTLLPELEQKIAASRVISTIKPALDVIDAEIAKAQAQNSATKVAQLQKLRATLVEPIPGFAGAIDPNTGIIMESQTPQTVLNLKRGFGDEHIGRWNPETMQGVEKTAARAYHQLDNQIDLSAPDAAGLNQRISSLIPVAQRAESISRNASLPQRVMGRVAAHSGALAGGIAGYHYGGIPGGLMGLVLPELISSASGQITVARALHLLGKGMESGAPAIDVPILAEIGKKK